MIRDREPQKVDWTEALQLTLPPTESCLKLWCVDHRMINPCLRLVPGLKMNEVSPPERRPINGRYGIEQLDTYTHQAVARCGFNITDQTIFDITHTPQGNRPTNLSEAERQRLRSRDFRGQMIGAMIKMAKILRLKEVRSIYSGDHHEVALGLLDDVDAYWRLDRPFESFAPKYQFKFQEVGAGAGIKGYWVMKLG